MANIDHWMLIIDFSGVMRKKEPEFFSKQVVKAKRFYIEASSSKKSKINVICGGYEHTDPDFKIERDDFPYYSIEFVAQGKGKLNLAGKDFDLKPGTVFTYGPGVSQFITADSQNTMIKYFLDFTGTSAKNILKQYAISPGTVKMTSQPADITRILDNLIKHGLSDSPYRTKICSTVLEYLILRIAETAAEEKTKLSQAYFTYQGCREYIKNNCYEAILVKY